MKEQIQMDQVYLYIICTKLPYASLIYNLHRNVFVTKIGFDILAGLDLSSVAKEIGQDGTSAGTAALETALDGLPPK